MGMGLSCRPSVSNKLGLSHRHSIRLDPTCIFCRQRIWGEGQRVPIEAQINDLENRARDRRDRYSYCFDCRQYVAFSDSRTWRKNIDAKIRFLFRLKEKNEKREAKLLATQEWPVKTKSLVGQYWSGDCPLNHGEMYLNVSDRFECPTCRIQIGTDGRAHVLRLKGLGKFKIKEKREFDMIHRDRISAVDELPGVGSFEIKEDHRVRD